MKDWFTLKELVGAPGLPATDNAILKKAKKENWKRRKPPGVKGRLHEYAFDSLPVDTRAYLWGGETETREETKSALATICCPLGHLP
ncbi:DNA-binding protein [Agarivorans sp. B2Z047]|uniref:DNA-binding protein n=1 Tax=Agarivorans sp. B2Z047 TaxID=2652721 RepID=UPI001D13C512